MKVVVTKQTKDIKLGTVPKIEEVQTPQCCTCRPKFQMPDRLTWMFALSIFHPWLLGNICRTWIVLLSEIEMEDGVKFWFSFPVYRNIYLCFRLFLSTLTIAWTYLLDYYHIFWLHLSPMKMTYCYWGKVNCYNLSGTILRNFVVVIGLWQKRVHDGFFLLWILLKLWLIFSFMACNFTQITFCGMQFCSKVGYSLYPYPVCL